MAVSVLCLFLAVPLVGLRSLIVEFTGLTHLLLEADLYKKKIAAIFFVQLAHLMKY